MTHQVSMALAALILASMLRTGAAAAQSDNCTNAIINLKHCLNYNANFCAPNTTCCTNLRAVLDSSPRCFCQLLNGTDSSLESVIDQLWALHLAAACPVPFSDVTECNGAGSDMFHRRQLPIGWLFLCYFAFDLFVASYFRHGLILH